MPGVGEVCPQCGEGHLAAKRGRFGPFVGCDRYPECRYIKKNPPPASEQFGTCPQCGQGTVVTKGPPRTPAVLGLRSLPRLRLRHLDAAGDRRRRAGQCGR